MKTLITSIAAFALTSSLVASHAQAEGAHKQKFFAGAQQAHNPRTHASYPVLYLGVKAKVSNGLDYRLSLRANDRGLGKACYMKKKDAGYCLQWNGKVNYTYSSNVSLRVDIIGNEVSAGLEYTF